MDTIKTILERVAGIPVYKNEAPEDAVYPYVVFEARRLSATNFLENYLLEINVWDKYHTYSRVEHFIKKIEKGLDREYDLGKDGLIICYKGNSQPVPDENKQIKRMREQFDMIVVERR